MRRPSTILDFRNCAIFVKIYFWAHFYVDTQNLVTIHGRSVELLRIFDFQNGGRLPSWIWYDVIAGHPRLVFDGLNILLKLHVDHVYTITLHDIAIFIFYPFGSKFPTPILGSFVGYYPKWFPILLQPQKDRPWAKTRRMSHKRCKSTHRFDLGVCLRKNTV